MRQLSSDIELLLSAPVKDSVELDKIFAKCRDGSFKPSNFEKLEEECLRVRSLKATCANIQLKEVTYAELKGLNEEVSKFKPTPEFRAISEKFSKASALRGAIISFPRCQSLKTRGVVTDERMDISKAVDIIDSAEELRVVFDHYDRFKEKVQDILDKMSAADEFLKEDDDFKTMGDVDFHIKELLDCLVDTPQIKRLSRIKDFLEQIEQVEKNLKYMQMTETNKATLQRISEMGFRTHQLDRLIAALDQIAGWKALLKAFEETPSAFNLQAFVDASLPGLFPEEQFNLLLAPPKCLTVPGEKKVLLERAKDQLEFVKRSYGNLSRTASLGNKIELIRMIYHLKIISPQLGQYLCNTREEILFYSHAALVFQSLPSAGQQYAFLITPVQDIIHRVRKENDINQIRRLASQDHFSHLEAYRALRNELEKLEQLIEDANRSIKSGNIEKIREYEVRLRDVAPCQETHQLLKKNLDFYEWRQEASQFVSNANSIDEEVEERRKKLIEEVREVQARIYNSEEKDYEEVCRWYLDQKENLNFLYQKIQSITGFVKVEKLSKLIQEEKSYEFNGDKSIVESLKKIKEALEIDLNNYSTFNEFHLPASLILLSELLRYRVRTSEMIDLLGKVRGIVEREREADGLLNIEQVKDKILGYKNQNLWTPYYAKLEHLKDWFIISDEISEKVIAKVTKQRVKIKSHLLNSILDNFDDFEVKVSSEENIVCVRRKEKEEGILNRPKREKRHNQFYYGKNIENKQLKTGKELVEDIVFDDFVVAPSEAQQTYCICDRGSVCSPQ